MSYRRDCVAEAAGRLVDIMRRRYSPEIPAVLNRLRPVPQRRTAEYELGARSA